MHEKLWNLRAQGGAALAPQPGDTIVAIDPNDIIVAVDFGSNKLKISFFQRSTGKLFFKDEIEAALAKGTDGIKRILSKKGMATALKELPRFREHILASGAKSVYVYATGAIRYAEEANVVLHEKLEKNPNLGKKHLENLDLCSTFIGQAQQALGYTIKPISGIREAELLGFGTIDVHTNIPKAIVAGIGGASFEIVVKDGNHIREPTEKRLGSLTTRTESNYKPEGAKKIITRELDSVEWLSQTQYQGLPLIAPGSLFRVVERVVLQRVRNLPFFSEFIHDFSLTRKDMLPVLENLSGMTGRDVEEFILTKLKGNEKDAYRNRIAHYTGKIHIGAGVLRELMGRTNSTALITSAASTRGGIAHAVRNNLDVSDILSSPVTGPS